MNFKILILIDSFVCHTILAEILSWSWTDATNRMTIIDANTYNTADMVVLRDEFIQNITKKYYVKKINASEIAYTISLLFPINKITFYDLAIQLYKSSKKLGTASTIPIELSKTHLYN